MRGAAARGARREPANALVPASRSTFLALRRPRTAASQLFARLFSWVSSGGEYAGRLSGFRPAGDLSYLATVLAPFLILCPAGSALARRAARRGAAALFGVGLSGALQPLASSTGDGYETASIPITRLASMAGYDWALRLRGDDVWWMAQVAARQHSVFAWVRFTAGGMGSLLVTFALLWAGGGVAPRRTQISPRLMHAGDGTLR